MSLPKALCDFEGGVLTSKPLSDLAGLCVTGAGGALPRRVVTNQLWEETLETSDTWIQTRTGIRQRHFASEDETTATLASEAAKNALESACFQPQDIDGIIVSTSSPDWTFPDTATLVQDHLGVKGWAFDVKGACGGFILALTQAFNMIRCGYAARILVIGAETMSRLIDTNDRRTAILFGDGAGAVVVEACDQKPSPLCDSLLRSDGRHWQSLYVDGGVSRTQSVGVIQMNGREVFRHAVSCMLEASQSLLEKHHLTWKDVDWFIPHQANLRIIEAIAERTNLDMQRVVATVPEHANTSAASIPLAMAHAAKKGCFKARDTMLLTALGAGFLWGSALITWDAHGRLAR